MKTWEIRMSVVRSYSDSTELVPSLWPAITLLSIAGFSRDREVFSGTLSSVFSFIHDSRSLCKVFEHQVVRGKSWLQTSSYSQHIHTHMNTHVYIIHTCAWAHMGTHEHNTHKQAHTNTRAWTHTWTHNAHICICASTQAHMWTHVHECTHKHVRCVLAHEHIGIYTNT